MTRSLTMCLLLSIGAPPVNLSNAIEREATRLARSAAPPADQDAAWARVKSLKSGSDILLATRQAPVVRRLFLNA